MVHKYIFTPLFWMFTLVTTLALTGGTICHAGTIMGKVVPAVETRVILLNDDGGWTDSTWTDKKGLFRFQDLSPGIYTVEARADGYITQRLAKPISVTNDSVSKGNLIRLARGAVLGGTISPANREVRVRVQAESGYCHYEDWKCVGTYSTSAFEGLPSGAYTLTAEAGVSEGKSWRRSKDYVPATYSITLTAGETTTLDIHLQQSGSISGKIGPTPIVGGVLAKNCVNGKIVDSAEIGYDGSYKLDGLAPGRYDLIILAENCERVFGYSPRPEVATLTIQEKQEIESVLSGCFDTKDSKDIDTLVALEVNKTGDEAEMRRKELVELLTIIASCSNRFRTDYIGGESGKSAIAICRMLMKCTIDEKGKTTEVTQMVHGVVSVVYETDNWKIREMQGFYQEDNISSFDNDVPTNINCDLSSPFVAPLEGEEGYGEPTLRIKPWRYSADPKITMIQVESGKESTGHDFTLTLIQ